MLSDNTKGIVLILVSALMACVGQLFWKLSADYGVLILLVGFFCYGIGALFMLVAYRYGELSVLQPMLSVNYVLAAILGFLILHEPITITKIIGILIISIGVICIGGSSEA